MLLGGTHNMDSMTVCLPLLPWEFLVFFKASKTLRNAQWCMLYLYSKGRTCRRESVWTRGKAEDRSLFLFAPPACLLSLCFPGSELIYLSVPPLGQVTKCLSSDALWTFVSILHFTFLLLVCIVLSSSVWPVRMSWDPGLHPCQQKVLWNTQ